MTMYTVFTPRNAIIFWQHCSPALPPCSKPDELNETDHIFANLSIMDTIFTEVSLMDTIFTTVSLIDTIFM